MFHNQIGFWSWAFGLYFFDGVKGYIGQSPKAKGPRPSPTE
jgi:hypothetical protein